MAKTDCFAFNPRRGARPDQCNALRTLECEKGDCAFYKPKTAINPDETLLLQGKSENCKKSKSVTRVVSTPPHRLAFRAGSYYKRGRKASFFLCMIPKNS